MNLTKYRNTIEQKKGQRDQILNQICSIEKNIKQEKRNHKYTEKAQLIIQTVAQQTQQELQFHITEIVSLALESVFDDPYKFEIDFVQKRGKTEAELYFIRNGKRMNPCDSTGIGAVDIASFALRIALWNLSKTRNTIILDEPFKNLSNNLQEKAGEMLKMISEKLKIQFIVITHNQKIIDCADKLFTVENRRGISYVS